MLHRGKNKILVASMAAPLASSPVDAAAAPWRQQESRSEDESVAKRRRRRVVSRQFYGGGSSEVWREFPKQALAFDFVDASDDADLRLWAVELDEGKRRYIVASYEKFVKEYRGGCYYELIREGSNCRAYFDVEGEGAEESVEDFLFAVAVSFSEDPSKKALEAECERLGHFDIHPDLLWRFYAGRPLTRDESLIETLRKYPNALEDLPKPYQLDATTETKFSRHAIFPTVVFRDSNHLGKFVASFLAAHPRFARIVDTSVYTRNRLFRLAHSSKRNKNNPFKPLEKGDDDAAPLLPERSLVVPVKEVTTTTIRVVEETECHVRRVSPSKGVATAPESAESLDSFVVSCRPGAYVRRRQKLSETKVAYHLAGNNRYCENIGRQHKSNNVIIVVDLAKNVARQRCHDPDCRHFNGFPIDIKIKN